MAGKYLSYADRTGEIAFAVIMVIIINGYVALSQLNTGFLYIVVVNIGACASWGFIDGFIYAISSSIARNTIRKKLIALNNLSKDQKVSEELLVQRVEKEAFSDNVLDSFSAEGKKALAKNIVTYAPQATIEKTKVLTKEETLGWLSIILIYLTVGFLLALPFLIIPDKLLAWVISNSIGVVWLFWYGYQLGRSIGKYKAVLGFLMAAFGITFLVVSYITWTA
jgi:VIT1/CCC1 family predicted Fe2+/Mn2+ transporter